MGMFLVVFILNDEANLDLRKISHRKISCNKDKVILLKVMRQIVDIH